MFEGLAIPQARPIVWLKRVLVFVIVALVTIELMSSYRAYYQVRDLELSAPHTSVATGRLQWTILPPPTVREMEVEIQ